MKDDAQLTYRPSLGITDEVTLPLSDPIETAGRMAPL